MLAETKINLGTIRQMAGLLEGEGTFGYYSRSPHISLTMIDKDVVEWAAKLMNNRNVYVNKGSHLGKKEQWRFTCHGSLAIGWMMTLYSFLGTRRRAQIKKAIDLWKAAPRKGTSPWKDYKES